MNTLTLTQSHVSITSREIAELVEKRHDNVKRTIDALVNQGVIARPQIEDVQEIGGNSRTYTTSEYRFTGEQGKRDSIVVVAQLSPEFTARLVDRWQELEAQIQQPALNPANMSRLQLLEMAMAAEQERLALTEENTKVKAELEQAAPKARALDRIAADDKALTVTQAAKVLGVKRESLTTWLHANGWMYRQNGSWVAYQQHINNGRLQFKEAKYTDENTGQEVHKPYCHITPKGLTKLAEAFGS